MLSSFPWQGRFEYISRYIDGNGARFWDLLLGILALLQNYDSTYLQLFCIAKYIRWMRQYFQGFLRFPHNATLLAPAGGPLLKYFHDRRSNELTILNELDGSIDIS